MVEHPRPDRIAWNGGRGRSPTTASGEPRRLGAGLPRLIADLGGPAEASGVELFSHWARLVGEEIAAHARPVAIEGHQLILVCDDPAWATQLRWLAPQILEAVADAGGPALEGLALRVRPPRRHPQA